MEAECLIPLTLNPKHCVLTGDVQQLPPTVKSRVGLDNRYDWSLMWRLQMECKQPMLQLREQYRMHPSIQQWPSTKFYDDRLEVAQAVLERPPLRRS